MLRIYGAERIGWLRFHLEVRLNCYSNWPHGFGLEGKWARKWFKSFNYWRIIYNVIGKLIDRDSYINAVVGTHFSGRTLPPVCLY